MACTFHTEREFIRGRQNRTDTRGMVVTKLGNLPYNTRSNHLLEVKVILNSMDRFDVPLSAPPGSAALIALVERAAFEAGLLISRGELRSYPGSTHWHLKRPGAKGTLELTYWPDAGRLWFAVHANRRAVWIEPAIRALTAQIVQGLVSIQSSVISHQEAIQR